MAGVRGNFAGLARLRGRLAELASPGFKARLAQGMGVAAMTQLSTGFQRSQDPYGRAWKPLKYRKGKPLLKTGRLRASATVLPAPAGFQLVLTADYASFHQSGTRRIPRRQMIPEGATGGLGPRWTKALRAEADKRVREELFLGKGPRGKGR